MRGLIILVKVLNLYANIGGNRKDWPEDAQVTAIEIDEEKARIYKDLYPNDIVIVGDAHQYLLEHYEEFDFIWASPPCPTHSRIRQLCGVLGGRHDAVYPDMRLYQEIIFLKHHFKGKWVVENVMSYYDPLIPPFKVGRHYFWSNFPIQYKNFRSSHIERATVEDLQMLHGIDLSSYSIKDKRLVLRDCVLPSLGLHIYREAYKEQQTVLA